MNDRRNAHSGTRRAARKVNYGFSMIELMIAMAVFMVVGGAAVSLFRQNTNLYVDQQNTTALNITMRNALTQIQGDVVNAANGFYTSGIATTGWNFGISATNANPGYDALRIITPAGPAAQLSACINTSTGTGTIVAPAGLTAANFTGNEVLFLNGGTNQFTASTVSGAAAAGANINLTFAATNTSGVSSDPDLIAAKAMPAGATDQLGDSFCPGTGDWVVLLNSTTYTVDGNNRLIRTDAAGNAVPIADQIIAFKVGVSQFSNNAAATSGQYFYDNSYNVRSTRSVRVSLIGRTNPAQFSGVTFANTFDGGNYKIEALSVVINPRNLSMNDCGSCN